MTSVMACTSRGLQFRAPGRLCCVAGCGGLGKVRPPPRPLYRYSSHLVSRIPVISESHLSKGTLSSHHANQRRNVRTISIYNSTVNRYGALGRGLYNNYTANHLSVDLSSMSDPLCSAYQSMIASSFTRGLRTSAAFCREESKVEETLEAMKEKIKEKTTVEGVATQKPAPEKPTASPPPSTEAPLPPKAVETTTSKEAPADDTTAVAKVTPKKPIKERIMDELRHYYHGFRLFAIDIKVSARLIWRVLKGDSLTRREQKQLVRTTADMFRMVPFLVFVIVPFAEFLLPVAVKLFPGMLPSTFQEANKEREKQRQRLQVKLEMAKFLQDTIEEMALQNKGGSGEKSVQEFGEFLHKIRTSGTQTSTEEIMKFSKLFEDEITLDNLTYQQLSALCKLLEVPPVGTSGLLRFQLEMKLRQLEADDKMIVKEGLDAMAVWELQDACRRRGMRAIGLAEERLKTQLSQWLDLHLNRKVPTSLLLLSRTLYLPEHLSAEEQIKATISTLPPSTADEAKVKILEVAGERVDNKSKLDIIRQEEEIIMKEKIEREAKEQEEAKAAAPAAKAAAPAATPAAGPAAAETVKAEEVIVDKAKVIEPKPEEILEPTAAETAAAKATDVVADKAEEIDSRDLNQIENILEKVAELNIQVEDLQALKQDVTEYKETLEDLRGVVATSGEQIELKESVAAQRLGKKVSKLIQQIDMTLGDLSKKTEVLMGDIREKEQHFEAMPSIEQRASKQEKLDLVSEKRHFITIVELLEAVKSASDKSKLEKIIKVLDEDQDGTIDVKDALKVIELLGREKMKLYPDQLTEIMTILQRESELELEKKRLKKQQQAESGAVPVSEASIEKASSPAGVKTPASSPASTPAEKSEEKSSKESQRL